MADTALENIYLASPRLIVSNWRTQKFRCLSNTDFSRQVATILSPKVLAKLPTHWRPVKAVNSVLDWLKRRAAECEVLLVEEKNSGQLIGFLLVYESCQQVSGRRLRIGYLLNESCWGQGYASELMAVFIRWCEKQTGIITLTAGTSEDNEASIRVLLKMGFERLASSPADSSALMFEKVVAIDNHPDNDC